MAEKKSTSKPIAKSAVAAPSETKSFTDSPSTLVLTIQSVVAGLLGLITTFHGTWFSGILADTHATVVCRAWGVAVLSLGFHAYNASSFSLNERVVVCRCMAVNYFVLAIVVFCEHTTDDVNNKETAENASLSGLAKSGLLISFVYILASFLWASLENVFKEKDYATLEKKDAFFSWTPLNLTILLNSFLALSFGALSVIHPAGLYEIPKKILMKGILEENDNDFLNPSGPLELFVIRCWGAFLIGIGVLCTQLLYFFSEFTTKSLKTFAKVMIFYFSALIVVFGSQWSQLNTIYQFASVPIFIVMVLLYIVAIITTVSSPEEEISEKKKIKKS